MNYRVETKFKKTGIGLISEDWESNSLEKFGIYIVDGDRGVNYPKPSELDADGHCLFLNTKNIQEDQFNFKECFFISKEKDNKLRSGKLKINDIVITTRGTVGNIAFYDKNIVYKNIRINSGMAIFRNYEDVFYPRFFYYLLKSRLLKNQFKILSTGSAQPQLPIKDLKEIMLLRPSIEEQIFISSILYSLDKKIELNNKINSILEQISQAIFKHWFIDFEFPNEQGKPYKSSGGEFIDSELWKIPKGWKINKIGEKLKTLLGGTPSRKVTDYWEGGNVPWVNSGKVNDFRIISPSEYITTIAVEESAAKLMPKGTTVIAITGATLGKVSRLEIDCCANQSVVGVLETGELSSEYIYLWVKNKIRTIISFQTGGAQQHINKNNIDNLLILIPEEKILNRFKKIIKPIFDKISINCFENKNLSQIRDTLLPKLITGKIRVNLKDVKEG